MTLGHSRVIWILLAAHAGLLAQRPAIRPNGVVNGASFAGTWKNEALVVGGAIFTIFGDNLAASTEQAAGTPLPTALAGTSVTVAGIPAPLFYVSPGQINFQVPFAFSKRVTERVPVVVTTAAGRSEPVMAWVYYSAPNIFSQDGSGCGQGVILNLAADGATWNGPSSSAAPGDLVTLYETGTGPLHGLAFGSLYLFDRGFGFIHAGEPLRQQLVPGLAGVTQTDFRISEDAPEGCAVPVGVGYPQVTMSIRKGGGPCQDAPPVTFGTLRWSRVVTTSEEMPAGSVEERFSGSFHSAPENLLRIKLSDPAPDPRCFCSSLSAPRASETYRCRNAGLTYLDAGELSLLGLPGGSRRLLPLPSTDSPTYGLALPPASLTGGTLRVIGKGGESVGGFESELTMPPPIRVTTTLEPGTVIALRRERPFTVNWTGGSPDTLVQLELRSYRTIPDFGSAEEGMVGNECTCWALGSAGQASVGLKKDAHNTIILEIEYPSENAEVVLTVTPRPSTPFVAPGLNQQGKHDWRYEYHFKNLKIR